MCSFGLVIPFHANDCSMAKIGESCQAAYNSASEAARKQDLTGFTKVFSPKLPINKQWQWVKYALSGRLNEFNPAN